MKTSASLKPALYSGAYIVLVALAVLWQNDFDATRLMFLGRQFIDPPGPAGITIHDNIGYDGQFYYRLALDPFTTEKCGQGICIDVPRYRSQRILYPVLARLLSLGLPPLVPYALVLLNIAGLGVIAYCGIAFAHWQGQAPILGMAFLLYVGFIYTFQRNLTEIVEIAFLLPALMLTGKRPALSALLMTCAALTRETAIIAAGVVLVVHFFERRPGWYWYLLPFVMLGAWELRLMLVWGAESGRPTLGVPFASFLRLLGQIFGGVRILEYFSVLMLVSLTVSVIAFGLRTSAPLTLKLAWVMYTAMLFSLRDDVWLGGTTSYLRVAAEWYTLGVMLIITGLPQCRSCSLPPNSAQNPPHQSARVKWFRAGWF